ncbi:MAG: hypothetical protein AB7O96_11555 [Pseudobdellovibrionaceae bacterium]
MNLLSKPNAFNPGADLWVIPDARSSLWIKKIDWYLNFQLMKVTPLSPQPLSTSLLKVLRETELEFASTSVSESSPLLVGSSNFFPNKWTVQLMYHQSLEDWCEKIAKTWKGLGHPSLRIFLPTQVKSEEFSKIWAQETKNTDFSVVLDS